MAPSSAEGVARTVPHTTAIPACGQLPGNRTRPNWALPRWKATFRDHVLVELPDARHFIQEDAPEEIAVAIRERFQPN